MNHNLLKIKEGGKSPFPHNITSSVLLTDSSGQWLWPCRGRCVSDGVWSFVAKQ